MRPESLYCTAYVCKRRVVRPTPNSGFKMYYIPLIFNGLCYRVLIVGNQRECSPVGHSEWTNCNITYFSYGNCRKHVKRNITEACWGVRVNNHSFKASTVDGRNGLLNLSATLLSVEPTGFAFSQLRVAGGGGG